MTTHHHPSHLIRYFSDSWDDLHRRKQGQHKNSDDDDDENEKNELETRKRKKKSLFISFLSLLLLR